MKDDLIQIAVISLWEFRNNKRKYFTVAGARKVVRDRMTDYIRKQSKFLDDVSIFDELAEDLQLIDTIPANEYNAPIEQKRYMMVLETIHEYIGELDPKAKKIISMYMNRRSFGEIAENVRLSKSTVHKCVKAFRRVMAFNLGLNIEV